MPAALRYAPLRQELGRDERIVVKDLEIYSGSTVPPKGYSLATELDGIDRTIDGLGEGSVHLYGHSGGGACALAYIARSPERVLSLAVDEPATDFSPEDLADVEAIAVATGPGEEAVSVADFIPTLFRTGMTPPPPPAGPPPDWMANRPAGIGGFRRALLEAEVDREAFRQFAGPVYYSFGTLSHERWETMAERLAGSFGDFTAEAYEGLFHMNTSHVAEPERVAARLRDLWARAEAA